MAKRSRKVYIKGHTLNIDNHSIFTISADYPYYRDKVNNWRKKLFALKQLGINIITFYLPWRHHAFKKNNHQEFDFSGRTQANRNVLKFIDICNNLNLYVVIKPGPFIHAETKCGGLPNFVIPENEGVKCQSQTNYMQINRIWWEDNIVPSPACPIFSKMVEEWFTVVDNEVLKPNIYPLRPIIAVQICNEGLYTDSSAGPLELDFSSASIKLFQKYCQYRYRSVANFNKLHKNKITKFGDIQPLLEKQLSCKISSQVLLELIDWRAYQNYYTTTILKRYSRYIKTPVTKVTNSALPYRMNKCVDYWICRNSYYKDLNIHQGFTNWVGIVSHDITAFEKYYFAIKYNKGINWEENWGFSKLYDKNYNYPIVPYYQTLLAIALGAKGFNVYTGVATSNWDQNIVTLNIKPYPKTPPINDDGSLGKKADILNKIIRFIEKEKTDFLNATRDTKVAFLWDLYYSTAVSFEKINDERLLHLSDFKIQKKLFGFCQKNNIDIDFFNMYCEDIDSLQSYRYFIVPVAFFMSKKFQQQVINLIRNGKKILYYGNLPRYDENLQPYSHLTDFMSNNTILKNIVKLNAKDCETERGWNDIFKKYNINPDFSVKKYKLFVERYYNDVSKSSFYFFFSRSDSNQTVDITVPEGLLEFNITARSALVFKINNGKLVSGIIKSVNMMDNKKTSVKLLLNGSGIINDKKSDYLFI